MNKIEKIRQEIKRLRKEIKDEKDPLAPNQKAGYLFALTDMESFLDTLSEEPDKSMEEEYKDYVENDPVYSKLVNGIAGRGIARHFAKWQKEQMMKDAYVESLIVEDGRIELGGDPLPCLNPIILLPYPQFELGDKVRILVLKEEE